MKAHFWVKSDEEVESGDGLAWNSHIQVRASTCDEPPDRPYQPLAGDPLRMSYFLAVHEAFENKDRDKMWAKRLILLTACRSKMPVAFFHCVSDEHAEKRRWKFSADLEMTASQIILKGWKKILAVTRLVPRIQVWQKSDKPPPASVAASSAIPESPRLFCVRCGFSDVASDCVAAWSGDSLAEATKGHRRHFFRYGRHVAPHPHKTRRRRLAGHHGRNRGRHGHVRSHHADASARPEQRAKLAGFLWPASPRQGLSHQIWITSAAPQIPIALRRRGHTFAL